MTNQQPNILIVEDEVIIAHDLKQNLEKCGYHVSDMAFNGQSAVEIASEICPDLLLMDIKLGEGIDGIEAATRINQLVNIPVVYLTAHADESILARARSSAPYGYLLKPYKSEELHTTIEIALQRHKIDQQIKEHESFLKVLSDLTPGYPHILRVEPEGKLVYEGVAHEHAFIEQSDDGIFLTDAQGMVTNWNNALSRMTGLPAERVQGKNIQVILKYIQDHESPMRLKELFQTVYQQMDAHPASPIQPEIFNLTIKPSNIQKIHIQGKIFPIYSASEILFGGILRDISTLRHKEDLTLLLAEALRAAANAICITDARGRITWVNPAFTQLTGYEESEVLGNTLHLLHSGRHDSIFYLNLWETILSGEIWSGEIINRHKDGSFYIEEQTITPVTDFQGKVRHFIAVKQDITQRRKTEESLRDAQKFASLGTLVGGIAHEINNPLQVITGLSDRIKNMSIPPELYDQIAEFEELYHAMQTINRNAWRMAHVVRTLVNYTNPPIQKFSENNLNDIVHDALTLLDYQFGVLSGITIETNLDKNLPELCCNRESLIEMMIHLLSNARDAMPEGGYIFIGTSYIVSKKGLLLQICDTGTGIPEDIREKIFDPFFTTKPIGSGIGMGLSIAQSTINQHGGSIEVESYQDGQKTGTAVMVFFPLEQNLLLGQKKPETRGRFDD